MAICRLKRVAADLRDDVTALLPKAPKKKNGKRVACVGAGPASLTVANDLLPLGYEVVIYEALDKPGGLMRSNIPSFRLPAEVLDEEIDMIVDMGADLRLGTPVKSMKALLAEKYDAVFVGSGAPKGKNLKLPGRDEASERIHIGIQWLESVAFGHIEKIGEKVLIIGVGNTAMDCCRTSLRLGAKSVKVMARKPREFFKASPWELEDAEEETVEIVVNHSPKSFVIEGRQAHRHDLREDGVRVRRPRPHHRREGRSARRSSPATTWCSPSARRTPSPGSSATSASSSTSGRCRSSTPRPTRARGPASSSAATRPSGPRTSSGPSSTATRPRSPSTSIARARTSPSACRSA